MSIPPATGVPSGDRLPSGVVAITGASGFIGQHLLQTFGDTQLRALSRRARAADDTAHWTRGDLTTPDTWPPLLRGAQTVMHLAPPSGAPSEAARLARAFAEACRDHGVGRVVLCSTAVVAGACPDHRVTEDTPCQPSTSYERAKWAVEEAFRATTTNAFELAVLRPTVVIGAGGRNLVKLARDLMGNPAPQRWLRRSVFGTRHMHLVPVEDVVAALRLLAAPDAPTGTFIVTSPDPANNFADIERRLGRALGVPDPVVPRMPVPDVALRVVLTLLRRSDTDPRRSYDGTKIAAAGLSHHTPLLPAVDRFATWYLASRVRSSSGA